MPSTTCLSVMQHINSLEFSRAADEGFSDTLHSKMRDIWMQTK